MVPQFRLNWYTDYFVHHGLINWQVSASKTKIYMVLEYVDGGELFDKIVSIYTLGLIPIIATTRFSWAVE